VVWSRVRTYEEALGLQGQTPRGSSSSSSQATETAVDAAVAAAVVPLLFCLDENQRFRNKTVSA